LPTKISDWKCNTCEHVWEFLSHLDEKYPECCPECSCIDIEPVVTGGLVTKCHDPEVKKEILKKRSADHTKQLVKKEAGHRGSLPPDFGRHRYK
jgi:hypothetical protein